ncbi:MAG: hypothetical protein PHC51_08710 [bacterium]|nr:hypothetical protein [bacterium]
MKNFNRTRATFLMLSVIALFACGRVSDGDPSSAPDVQKSVKSLRLLQNTDPASPVAVSIATDTKETVVVMASGTSLEGGEQILYTSDSGQVAVLSVNNLGLPLKATARNATLNFGNYNSTTLDVEAIIDGISYPVKTVPLQQETIDLLTKSYNSSIFEKGSIGYSISSVIRRSAVAVRTFGCATFLAAPTSTATNSLLSLSERSCRSRLVDSLKEIANTESDETINDRVRTTNTVASQCNSVDFDNDFESAENCALTASKEVITNISEDDPSFESLIEDASDGVLGNQDNEDGFGSENEESSIAPNGNDNETNSSNTNNENTDEGNTGGTDGGNTGGTDGGSTGGTDGGDTGGTDGTPTTPVEPEPVLPQPPVDFPAPPTPPKPIGPTPLA